MIDVNDLDGLLELANDYVYDGLPFLTEPVSYGDLVILVERIIAAEKDASRYRWLRDESAGIEAKAPLVFNADEYGTSSTVIDGEHLDAAIDKAMRCSK